MRMKQLGVLSLLLLIAIQSQAQVYPKNRSFELAPISGRAGEAQCIGKPGDPLKVIYLHGFRPNRHEASNIEALRREAAEKGIRIALPASKEGWQYWNTKKALLDIERDSQKVCGQPLDDEMALYGFSNGSYMSRNLAKLPCSETTRYRAILAMGMPRKHMAFNEDRECRKKLIYLEPHRSPSREELQLATNRLIPAPTVATVNQRGQGRN